MSAHPDLITVGEDRNRKIDVVSSEEICRGGCRIETELGVLDATIPTQLEEIKRQLLDGESCRARLLSSLRLLSFLSSLRYFVDLVHLVYFVIWFIRSIFVVGFIS